jgi:hypothetical protein
VKLSVSTLRYCSTLGAVEDDPFADDPPPAQ